MEALTVIHKGFETAKHVGTFVLDRLKGGAWSNIGGEHEYTVQAASLQYYSVPETQNIIKGEE